MNKVLTGYAWGQWVYGLAAAVIGGGASAGYGALSVTIVDPKDFNPQTNKFWYVAGLMFGFGAMTSFLMYLKEHPVPELISSEKHESVQVSQIPNVGTGDGTAIKTVKTTTEEKVEVKPTDPAKPSDK